MANLLGALDLDSASKLQRATRHDDMANVARVDGPIKAVTKAYLLNVKQPPPNPPRNVQAQ